MFDEEKYMLDSGIRKILLNGKTVEEVHLPFEEAQWKFQAYMRDMYTHINKGMRLFVYGAPSSGRSTVCTILAKDAIAREKSVAYVQAYQLSDMKEVRKLPYPFCFESFEEFLSTSDLLVVEDVHMPRFFPDTLAKVLEHRYNNNMAVIMSGICVFGRPGNLGYDVLRRQGFEDAMIRCEKSLGPQWPYRIGLEYDRLFTGTSPYNPSNVFRPKPVLPSKDDVKEEGNEG